MAVLAGPDHNRTHKKRLEPSMKIDARNALRMGIVVAATLSLAACASKPAPQPAPAPAPPPVQTPAEPSYTPPPAPPPVSTAPLPGSVQDFAINVGDRVYFDTDSYDIRSDAAPVLASQASWLNQYPSVRVRIEGNADERGTREYNLALGARRANSARAFLISPGVDGSRLRTVSYGKERPVAIGSDENAWSQNSRAVSVGAGAPTS
jgi:peptidoglycan-associated lipoprotein